MVSDSEFAQQMERMLQADFEHAVIIDPNNWDQRPILWRLGVQLSRLAAPVL